MSASLGSEGGQDFDLNLAPIIDCFTVLITYLLVSASFLAVAVLNVGVAASGGGAPGSSSEPPVSLEVELHQNKSITLNIRGGPRNLDLHIPLQAVATGWDFSQMQSRISTLKKENMTLQEATITAEATVRYNEVVKIIENLKPVVGKVFLAG